MRAIHKQTGEGCAFQHLGNNHTLTIYRRRAIQELDIEQRSVIVFGGACIEVMPSSMFLDRFEVTGAEGTA